MTEVRVAASTELPEGGMLGVVIGEKRLALYRASGRLYATDDICTHIYAFLSRGTFDPAYLNYTMGKLMIRKLRDDWTATRGGGKAWHDFHDQFLQFGGPPIPLVRAAMLGPTGGPPL